MWSRTGSRSELCAGHQAAGTAAPGTRTSGTDGAFRGRAPEKPLALAVGSRHTKVDHMAGRFMSLVTNTSFCSSALLVLRALQFLPTTGVLLATGLLFGKQSKLLVALMFEGTDTTSGDDQGSTHVRRDCCEVDFTKVDGSLVLAWSLFSAWYLDADMQFKTMIPDQRTRPALCRKRKPQDDGTDGPRPIGKMTRPASTLTA